MKRFLGTFFFLSFSAAAALGQISAPEAVEIGEVFEATWEGEKAEGTIELVKSDGSTRDGGTVRSYLPADEMPQTVKVTAPVHPGEYGLALVRKGQREREHLTVFAVEDVEATLDPPGTVAINEEFEVGWSGPVQAGATIAVLNPEDAPKRARWSYIYTANAKSDTVKLRAPREPGTYRIVYEMKRRILEEMELVVGASEAKLTGPGEIGAGSPVEIGWEGPDNPGDRLGFAEPGSDKLSGRYGYLANHEENTLQLTAPEETGAWEVLYLTGDVVLARHPIEVTPVTATLEAPAEVVAGTRFDVTWTGPGNRSDRIQIHGPGESGDLVGASYFKGRGENPVTMTAPFEVGNYFLKYITAKGKPLAERPITVTPAPQPPGLLRVSLETTGGIVGPNSAVEVILDASGSMLQRQGGETRIAIAREALLGLLGDTIPVGTPFALRVFGHREPNSCRTDLEIPLGPLDLEATRRTVSGIEAMNLAKTPIGASLAKVSSDLAAATGEKIVILLTDGEETCGGDPAREIDLLRASGADVRVNIVGYAIDDPALQDTFRAWAAAGGGEYFDAPDAEQLRAAMKAALEIPFEVRRDGATVLQSVTGHKTVSLMPGDYEVVARWNGAEVRKTVTIEPEKTSALVLP